MERILRQRKNKAVVDKPSAKMIQFAMQESSSEPYRSSRWPRAGFTRAFLLGRMVSAIDISQTDYNGDREGLLFKYDELVSQTIANEKKHHKR